MWHKTTVTSGKAEMRIHRQNTHSPITIDIIAINAFHLIIIVIQNVNVPQCAGALHLVIDPTVWLTVQGMRPDLGGVQDSRLDIVRESVTQDLDDRTSVM